MTEFLLFLLLVVVIVMLTRFKSETEGKLTLMLRVMEDLQNQMQQLDKNMGRGEKPSVAPAQTREEKIAEPIKPVEPTPVPVVEQKIPEKKIPRPIPVAPQIPKKNIPVPPPSRSPGRVATFLQRNPDLEKFIGENLFNKIGIAVLVLGVGFFLKYAIDKNWINEIGRTAIGILCGALLTFFAHRTRKSFPAFSSVLIGGGVAVYYFTNTIAFQQYHLTGQTLAFIISVLITLFTVLLSLGYDRKELAVLAIMGGFASPFMVSTGASNAVVLLTYILILNIGMLILAAYKKWHIVNVVSFVFTVLLVGSWLLYAILNNDGKTPFGAVFVFTTAFYLVFFLMNVLYNIRYQRSFGVGEIILLLSNTFFYYAVGMILLRELKIESWQGLFTVLIAAFNFVFAYLLLKREGVDRNLVFLLIGLVLTFISLAAPVQLEGNYITLFWAAEAVLLLWLAQKSGLKLLRYGSVIVVVLMIFSLLMDWAQIPIYRLRPHMPVLVNRLVVTGLAACASLYLIRQLTTSEPDNSFQPLWNTRSYRAILAVLQVVLLFFTLLIEVDYQASWYFRPIRPILNSVYIYLFLAFLLFRIASGIQLVKDICLIAAIVALLVFPLFLNPVIRSVRWEYLTNRLPSGYFLAGMLLILSVVLMLVAAYRMVLRTQDYRLEAFRWISSGGMLFIVSASLDHLGVFLSIQPSSDPRIVGEKNYQLIEHLQRTGYAILWGLFAFVLMYFGLKKKSRQLRIIAILVFALTLGKLFLWDFRSLSEAGKIAAFISLGVLLLTISFMYQRLKKILLADDHAENPISST